MTTDTRSSPTFSLRAGSSGRRGLFIAALCLFMGVAFLLDVQRGVTRRATAASVVEQT